jgi:uncharacterized cupin superfamily protein
MKPFKVNIADLPSHPFAQGRFGSFDQDADDHLRSERISTVLTRLEPGQVSCPYHCHHVSEELFIVVSGEGTVRYDGECRPLRAGDFVSCPTGRQGAHQIINDSAAPLIYWAISTIEPVEICEYPDSGKILTLIANAGDGERVVRVHRDADSVDYWTGES